jgi:molecular chaperone GrpE
LSSFGPKNPTRGATPSGPSDSDFALSIGDDLIAEALAAVERRAEESRQARVHETEEEDSESEPLEIVFDDEEEGIGFEDGNAELDGAVDLGDLDALLDAHSGDSRGASGDELLLLDKLEAVQMALETAEHALQDAELERDDALKGRSKARRSARKYKTALEREVEQRQRLGSTQKLLRERLARAETKLEDSESERQTVVANLQAVSTDLERSQRDIQRLRAREEQTREDATWKAIERLCKKILPVLDNLELALRHTDASAEKVVEGVEMVANQFTNALGNIGLVRIESSPGTRFDPSHHEAMQTIESADHIPNTVVNEIQVGFELQGRLLRASRVIVARAPTPSTAADLEALADAEPAAAESVAERDTLASANADATAPDSANAETTLLDSADAESSILDSANAGSTALDSANAEPAAPDTNEPSDSSIPEAEA